MSSDPPAPAPEAPEAAAQAELQRTVGLLLSTQQALFDLRHKRDREQRVLDGIVRFSERVLPAASEPAFWESVVDAATETFECESCLAVELSGESVALLAARGPRPTSPGELADAGRVFADLLRRRHPFAEDAELAGLAFGGGSVATLMIAPIHAAAGEAERALVSSVSARKKPFFPTFDALCVPGLRVFASHVDVLHQMLGSRHRIAEQVRALDRSNAALAEANRSLELRFEEQQRGEAEREALRAQLAQAQRLESIGRLAGGVAHDFNNLLSVVSSATEMLLEAPELSVDSRDLVSDVRDASQRARALTQQLLMFGRKQVIKPRPADMNSAIARSLRIYRSLIGEDLALRFQPCAEPTPVFVDEQQFDQLLGNLLVNARDAIHAAGAAARLREIHVSTSALRSGSPLGRPAVRLEVRDTGVGMDEATRESIFEPFFTTKASGLGTGLGLSTVLGVVQQNHGRIEVESAPGAGAAFSVYWPLLDGAQVEGSEAPPDPRPAHGTEHVLLVEDEERVRRLQARLLRRLGFAVTDFGDGASALAALEGGLAIDVLVTDVVMPGMNGRELAEAVHRRRPGLPVLFVSGYTDDIVARQGIIREGVALLEKPFTAAALGTSLRGLLDARGRRG